MIKFWAICRNTFVQTVRQPIYIVLIGVTFILLVVAVPLSSWTMGRGQAEFHETDQLQLENVGLATLMVSCLLIAAFGASGVLTREIEEGTALTVISKPVSRGTFVLGKFGGVAGAVAVAFYICGIVFLMTVRHQVISTGSDPCDWPVIVLGTSAVLGAIIVAMAGNYFFGWQFTSAVVWCNLCLLTIAMAVITFVGKDSHGNQWIIVPFGQDIRPQLLVGMGLIFMAVLVMAAIAVAASTRLGQVTTLLLCTGVFFVGSIHPYLFTRCGETVAVARLIGWIAPDLTGFYPYDVLVAEKSFPGRYVAVAGTYCVVYTAAVLAFGMALFQRRSLEGQGSASAGGAVNVMAWIGRAGAVILAVAALEGPLSLLMGRIDPNFRSALLQEFQLRLGSESPAMGLIPCGAMLVAAVVGWIVWGHFGRGARWSYWVVMTGTILAGAWCATALFVPAVRVFEARPVPGPAQQDLGGTFGYAAVAVAAAITFIVLLFPKSRHHFKSA